jgi:hypothetical protein
MTKQQIEWEVVEPIIGPKTEDQARDDAWAEAWLDYLDHLGRLADRYEFWIG